MNLVLAALAWLFDPAHWTGRVAPLPIQARIGEHLWYTVLALLIASAIALPAGFYIGHTGRGRQFVIAFTGAMRALPTLGALFFLTMTLGGVIRGTFGVFLGVMIALVILAIPSILAGAYAGLESVNRSTVDAARAVGMTEWQILFRVEIPLALPLIVGGLRAGALQVIATAVIASYVGVGGIGSILSLGIGLNDYDIILAGALLVTALAIVVDTLFAILQRLVRVPGAPTTRPRRRVRRHTGDRSVVIRPITERTPA